jgi:hypothetical protein
VQASTSGVAQSRLAVLLSSWSQLQPRIRRVMDD